MSKRKAVQQLTCQHPDRDCPKLVCGYPLPCPWHTIIIDCEKSPPTIEVPITNKQPEQIMARLKNIAVILSKP